MRVKIVVIFVAVEKKEERKAFLRIMQITWNKNNHKALNKVIPISPFLSWMVIGIFCTGAVKRKSV